MVFIFEVIFFRFLGGLDVQLFVARAEKTGGEYNNE
jgi:hypothetical protein